MTEPNDSPSTPPQGIPWLGLVAIVAVLVVLTGIAVYSGIWRPQGDVAVPKVVGEELKDARDALSAVDLDVGRVERRETPTRAGNMVLDQTPSPGSIIPRGSSVSLIVSRNVGRGEVPDIRRMGIQEAATEIQDAGYQIKITAVKSTKAKPGSILRQSPAPGKRSKSRTVTVYVAISVEELIQTPSVLGLAQPAAVSVLEDVGFKTFSRWVAAPQARIVVHQYPPPGMLAAPGTVVQLDISGGLDDPSLPTAGIAGKP